MTLPSARICFVPWVTDMMDVSVYSDQVALSELFTSRARCVGTLDSKARNYAIAGICMICSVYTFIYQFAHH